MASLRRKLLGLTISSSSRLSLQLASFRNPNFTHPKYSSFSTFSTQPEQHSTPSSLVGWWSGMSEDHKDPYGRIIHISAEHGRYLARSYSPWQFATAQDGTPLFEIYVTTGLDGEHMEQAIYLKHNHKNGNEDAQDGESMGSMGSWKDLHVGLKVFKSLTEYDLEGVSEVLKKLFVEGEVDKATENVSDSPSEVPYGKKSAIFMEFFVGGEFGCLVEKKTRTLHKKLLRVPVVLERECCFSFRLTVEQDKDQHALFDNICEGYRIMDHFILDLVDTVGRKKFVKEKVGNKFGQLILSQAKNQMPLLSGLTTFHRIHIPASSDPLSGLYLGSNGYLVTEVIQIRRKFGRWHENGGIEDHSLESYDYIEAVKLIGDPDVPAGKVAFRAKVGEKYKLPPGPVLEEVFGAVARYKGQGRLAGFQNAGWVDGEVIIFEGENLKDGFAIGLLYSAPEYHVVKLFKQLRLPGIQ